MSITDELRKAADDIASTAVPCGASPDYIGVRRKIAAIADRIDAEHEEAIQQALMGEGGVPATDENMAKLGWIRLPKDADGEYIRVGERVQLIGNDPSTVSHMSLADDGWRVYVKYDGGIGTGSGEPKRIRHYHAPTVEDVLREFALAVCKDEALTIRKGVVEEYAKRLTLAEGEDA